MESTTAGEPVFVHSRLGRLPATKTGRIVWFDLQDSIVDRTVRHFLFLDESVKLMYQPWGWQKQWYIDVVKITERVGGEIDVDDLYIDFIVEEDGPTYRIIDLDDLAHVTRNASVPVEDIATALEIAQNFADRHLHKNMDFPPHAIVEIGVEPVTEPVQKTHSEELYRFLRAAIEVARQSGKDGNDPFGAILVKDSQIVATSADRSVRESDPTRHAELALISDFCRAEKIFDLSEYTIFTSTEPCVMCSGAIKWAKLGQIVYSVSQYALQSISGGQLKPNAAWLINSGRQRVKVIGPIIEDEGIAVFRDFPLQGKSDLHARMHPAAREDSY